MADPFADAVKDYYSEKTEYEKLRAALEVDEENPSHAKDGEAKSSLAKLSSSPPTSSSFPNPSLPKPTTKPLRSPEEILQKHEDANRSIAEAATEAKLLYGKLVYADGKSIPFEDIAKKIHDQRRQDERATDKASQERKKQWAGVDRLLGHPPTKW